MDEPGLTTEAGEAFARRVLATAASAGAAADDPRASRAIAMMLGSLAAEGYVEAVGAFLAPDPQDVATFEVRTFRRGDISPAHEVSGLDVSTALREARRLAEGDSDLVEIAAVGPGGLRRRVMERRQREGFHFLFPEPGAYEGDEGQRDRALAQWRAMIDPPAPVPGGPHPGSDRPADPRVLPAVATPDPREAASREAASREAVRREAASREVVSRAVREALGDVTVEVDLGAIEQVVSAALRRAMEEAAALPGRVTPPALPPAAEADPSAQLERLLPELTDRLAAVVDDRLQAAAHRESGAEAPTARQIADMIAAQLLAKSPPPRREVATTGDPPGGWVAQATLVAAAEQLHLQFETFNDRVRSSSRSLEALADELTSRERTAAAYTDRLAQSLNAGMDRLGRRVDARLDDLRAAGSNDRGAGELGRLVERLTDALQHLERALPDPADRPPAPIRSLRPSADQP